MLTLSIFYEFKSNSNKKNNLICKLSFTAMRAYLSSTKFIVNKSCRLRLSEYISGILLCFSLYYTIFLLHSRKTFNQI